MKTILLKLAGPLQSWGTRSHFEIRHTDNHPSKSAIIGILAAATGCRRDDKAGIQKLNELHYAVRVDQAGRIIEDYHTAHKYKYTPEEVLDRTYVTRREYLEDAVFIAAIGSENEQWIEEIVQALEKPYFQLFAGRRSCPLTADSYLGCLSDDTLSALKKTPWQAADWYKKTLSPDQNKMVRLRVYSDADLLPEEKTSRLRRDLAISFSGKSRQYEYRREQESEVWVAREPMEILEEHDAFGAL